ncbi:hypothetical protein RJT34_22898 [Clitoria ternatea]|uniref:J domain-containing protein n=1 Tax=Clitoria ternatea TaxID=43366 RepID=A0AAN9FLI8_CLITE
MECNKDEAVRARGIAEARMQKGEFMEALKFATKAQKLCPDVENIARILTVCQVHCAAQKEIFASGMDWYAILQTERLADETTIKKQYRKLALLLHPDKNKFAGAEAAFKLIGEANGVLSDPTKRSVYDIKLRALRPMAPKAPSHRSKENIVPANHAGDATNHKKNAFSSFTYSCQQGGQMTFKTACQNCNEMHEFYMPFVNTTLRCQKCLKFFKAVYYRYRGVSPGYTRVNIQKEGSMNGRPNPASESSGGKPVGGEYARTTFAHSNPVSMEKRATAAGCHSPASKVMESQTCKNVGSKRVRQSAPGSGESFKARNGDDVKDANVQRNNADPSRLNTRRSSRQRQHVSYVEASEYDDFEIPSKKPRENGSFDANEVENSEVRNEKSSSAEEPFSKNKSKVEQSNVEGEKVPASDFNDFEKDKEEDCFAVNQLWALYDPADSMPRFYALIKKVASPFKLKITWLDPDPDGQGENDWHDADLPVGCGKFKLGGSQKTTDRSMFSHQIQCMKGSSKGSYLVYPKKGETWAIFRDWDIKWSSNPENHLKYEFEYVEILSDFAEVGIEVAYLSKVNGFVSLFQKTEKDGVNIFRVLPYELYRFSHPIPSYRMTGKEREGVPSGSFELDPAALPNNIF